MADERRFFQRVAHRETGYLVWRRESRSPVPFRPAIKPRFTALAGLSCQSSLNEMPRSQIGVARPSRSHYIRFHKRRVSNVVRQCFLLACPLQVKVINIVSRG